MGAWEEYQSAIREVVRVSWEERQVLLRWRAMVADTHGDANTLAFLDRRLRLGNTYPALIEHGRRLGRSVDDGS